MKKTAILFFSLTLMFLVFSPVFSQGPQAPPEVDPWAAVDTITNLVFGVLLAVAVVAIIYAGFLFITGAGGKEGNVSQAKTMLLYAIVGIIVALLARGIVNYLQELLS